MRRDQCSVVVVVRPVRERLRDVRQLSPLLGLVHLVEHVLRDAKLVERRDPAVEHLRGARTHRLVSAVFERRREHRREQEQAEHDSCMPCGQRPATVHDLFGAAGDRSLGEGGEGEADSRPDEELGRDRPAPAGPRKERERRQPPGDEDDAAGHPACRRRPSRSRKARRRDGGERQHRHHEPRRRRRHAPAGDEQEHEEEERSDETAGKEEQRGVGAQVRPSGGLARAGARRCPAAP